MSGLQTKLHTDDDGRLVVQNSQDFTAILDDAKARHNEGQHGSNDFKHAARIPDIVVQTYLNTQNISFQEFMNNPVHLRAMLNDPDLRDLRIWPGKV